MISMICLLGLELKHSYLLALLCLHGNMFVKIISSIQYQVIKQSADDAFYELQNPAEQIQPYIFDGKYLLLFQLLYHKTWKDNSITYRAQVPRMTLDQLFEQKNEVAKTVLEELEKVMVEYGCTIKHILMVDIILDPSVRGAMNEINAGNCLFCLSGQQLLYFQTSRGYII
ncbi:putative Band 7/SPFH domain superfamily protein [Helianthus annuus]|uniref:Band 7/SPFH domain superfamily protein n=1 Tax=Helianthus annuus TaxID=4232 RepID=A0A251SEG7_HELAN|nr:putative Band 7/SPFH domain superfamily protein [Helianthus annuus]KAJ0462815.1 putative Band 7/SPFH domain superfamily protein [Helianthus annuus]KAJ0484152.1 putative Band 7/SPFH domain superfamily protein [Helianthus annuus]KAJ0658458.1 putative Band 7/SPFH domain superfamily protein [Helianthus annuus]